MVKICKGGHHRQPFFSVCWLWNRKLAALPLLIWRKRSESQHNCRSQSECPGSWASQQAWLPSLPSLSLECCLCKNFIKASEWCYASQFDTLELQHRCFNLKGSIHSRQAEWQEDHRGHARIDAIQADSGALVGCLNGWSVKTVAPYPEGSDPMIVFLRLLRT